jgi:HEAT repeat protein
LRTVVFGSAVGLCVSLAGFGAAGPFPPDPVRDIRNAIVDNKAITPDQIENLRTLGDLTEAIQLINQGSARVEPELRERLAQRFKKTGLEDLKSTQFRWPAIILLADLASQERQATTANPYLRISLVQMIPAFAEYTKDNDQRVRASAVLSLGNAIAMATPEFVETDPRDLTKPIESLLLNGKTTSDREAAAEGLGNLVRNPVPFDFAEVKAVEYGSVFGIIVPGYRPQVILGRLDQTRIGIGQTLMVYSPFPKSQFLGRIRVSSSREREDTKEREAVCEVLGKPVRPIEKGDRVSSKVDLSSEVITIASKKILAPEKEPDVEVRRLTVNALELTTSGNLSLIREENDQELTNQLPFFQVLAQSAKALATATEDPDTEVRLSALRTMEDIGTIRERLRPLRQGLAPEAASILPAPLKEALPALSRSVREDPDARCRLTAVEALERIPDVLSQENPESETALKSLIKAIRDNSLFVRWATGRTLGKVAPVMPNLVLPALTELLLDPRSDGDVQNAAATAIRRYGETQTAAKTPTDAEVMAATVRALVRTSGQGYPYEVINGVYHGDSTVRLNSLRALDAIGEAAASAIPDLIAVLQDTNVEVRQNAALVLGHFGKKAESAIPALNKALGDPEPDFRRYVSEALLRIEGR